MMINWYPGHMAKAKRQITEQLKLIDVVIEVLDARIPYSSRNPDITDMIKNKRHIIVLNKSDLADGTITNLWINSFNEKYGLKAISINSVRGTGLKNLLYHIEEDRAKITEKRKEKGMMARPIRAMILGIPNVGKSKLINSIAGVNKVKVENRPGVTRALSWVRLRNGIELMDTPGLLWPRQNDQNVAINLALTGTIKQDIIDTYELCLLLIEKLQEIKPEVLQERYGIELANNSEIIFTQIAEKRGCVLKGGEIDFERTSGLILSEFQSGKLGKISLEKPGLEK